MMKAGGEDPIKITMEDIGIHYDPNHRRHFILTIESLDYDEDGNNPRTEKLYSSKVFLSRSELENFALKLVKSHMQNHFSVTAYAEPTEFLVVSAIRLEQKTTEEIPNGQIRFSL